MTWLESHRLWLIPLVLFILLCLSTLVSDAVADYVKLLLKVVLL